MPHRYKQLDMMEYLLDKVMKDLNCPDDVYVLDHSKEWDRVRLEMSLYNQRGLLPMLKFLVYMVDNMREHKVVWGVGRGSSVASYVLYLIGVHRINSVKYNLDFKEFLR
jgi:DNA polymerase III alpha subunit